MDPIWEELHSARGWGKYPADALVSRVMRHYREPARRASAKVLEIGCGGGANLSFLAAEGFQVYGLDGSPSAVQNARLMLENSVHPDQTLDLWTCWFEDMELAPEFYDLIIDHFAVYANQTQIIHQTFEKVHKALSPGGYFYSKVWGTATSGSDTGTIIEPGTSENPTTGPCKDMGLSHFFAEKELRECFSHWGNFEILQTNKRVVGASSSNIEEFEVWAQK